MFKLDDELIKDRFSATSYSFYTDEEITKLSVKQILNSTAFDHLGKPTNGGIYDKALGVSPFDHRSNCVTCGLDCNFCPGHVGHIELTAPVYNPFLVNHLYKLLKSKCFGCHRLRIHPRKQFFAIQHCCRIEIYAMCLKLIKSGNIVGSQVIKNYFLNAAKEVKLLSDQQLLDPKKLEVLKNNLDRLVRGKSNVKEVDTDDIATYFLRLDKKFRKLKSKQEEKLQDMFQEFITYHQEEDYLHTSIAQKSIKDLIHDLWAQVIPIQCPHCQAKSPSYRKDGYTKIFQRPLSDKIRNQMKQQDRVSNKSPRRSSVKDDGFEINTQASTRKESHTQDKTSTHEDDYSQGNDYEDEDEEEENLENVTHQKLLTPIEVKDQIERLWAKDKDLLELIFGRYYPVMDGEAFVTDSLGPKMFFITKLLVPPNRFRPESQGGFGGQAGGGDKAFLHAHSAMLSKILNLNFALKDSLLHQEEPHMIQSSQASEKSGISESIQKWLQLQDAINTFMDSSMAQKTSDREQNGLRQLLERKEGMFRMKMMGKRVNFGARSVISPDPYITTDQIGVPIFMARKLTFPESVSLINAEKLRKLVMNGSKQHPGANMIEDEETGVRTHLETLNYQQRKGLASLLTVGKKVVYRHLNTGDVLLVNRQPTLHKPSIMAHVARILPKEQTIRMHYANCSTYNADFDGDEMNLHFPQSYLACSEAYKIMATHKQYIVPTSGKPIRGLIQDSVVSGVFLSSKDTFLNKEQYQQLVYIGLRELIEDEKLARIFTLQPSILKPRPMWTGKQVISTILKNIVNQEHDYKVNKLTGLNLDSKSKLPAKEWGPIGVEEGDVVIRDNELLQGTIDKNQYGASEFGMVHSFYEIYGSEKAGELLTSLARIFTVFLQMHGFSCGLDDLMISPEYNKKRRMIIEKSHKEGVEAAAGFCGLKNFKAKQYNYSNRIVFQSDLRPKDKDIEKFTKMSIPENPFEGKEIIQMDDPTRTALEYKMNTSEDMAKLDAELDNTMRNKMSKATSEILKETIPDGLIKRFPRNNISAMVLTGAKGGLVNMTQISCLLGQQELEGKRVPKMQNGKTLPCYVPHDPNPRSGGYVTDRFITGLRPQDFFFHCMAGREGLIDTAVKTSRSGYLQRCLIKQLESLIVNYDMTVRDNDGSIVQFLYGEDAVDVMNNKYLDRFGFLDQNFTSLITQYNGSEILERVNKESVDNYKSKARRHLKIVKRDNPGISKTELKKHKADPAISVFHPQIHFGAISERMEQQLNDYIENESMFKQNEKLGANALKSKFKPIQGDTFRKTYFLKYMRSLVNPGENVGTIAGQSVGEPSTQMTLNTFHLAGHGAGNMTLGVPRLKEILMTTPTNIKTPSMNVYFRKDIKLAKQDMEKFANKFKRLRLSDVTKEVQVNQYIQPETQGSFKRIYKVTLQFEAKDKIQKFLGISFKDLVQIFSDQFVPLLMNETLKQLKKGSEGVSVDDAKTVATKTGIARDARNASKVMKTGPGAAENDVIEEEEMLLKNSSHKSKSKRDEDEDDEEDEDFDMDIDGVQKKAKDVRGYEQDDDDKRNGSENDIDPDGEHNEDEDEIKKHCNVLKEKFAKFLGLVRGISYDQDQSVTVEIGFPLEYKKVLMLTLAESLLSKVLVRSIQGIDRCIFISPEKANEEPYLLVQGLNFDAFYRCQDIVDVNRIQTNDIWNMMQKYGIEAGRANLVNEVKTVFGMYGIEVNPRHLSLIADFMTFNGNYRAFNRIGMEESSSPFLKMSFETTMKYLIGSCLTKDIDNMSTPSSALVLGQVPRVGTGIFDIIHDPEAALDN